MYANLLVYLDPDRDNTALLKIAGELAERHGAGITGISVSQPISAVCSQGTLPGDILDLDENEVQQGMQKANEQFHTLLRGRVPRLAWRSSNVSNEKPVDYVARQARCADLVVTHSDYDKALFDEARRISAADLVMQAGRPVLAVPAPLGTLAARHVLVAWKDAPAARRAVADALPLLKQAKQVIVAEVTDAPPSQVPDGANDVAAWLTQHGVAAESVVERANGDTGNQLLTLALANDADLIVSGAYGHHRLREWAFGGVTRSLLAQNGMCALLSH